MAAATAAGLALLGIFAATPASAHPTHAYHGNRGQAWTNTDHTRIAIADNRCDDLYVYVRIFDRRGNHIVSRKDFNGCRAGYNAVIRTWDGGLGSIQVCTEGRGCGRGIKV